MPEYVIGIDGVQDAKDFGKVGWGKFAFSLLQIFIGLGMVILGYVYLDDCNNGATTFLFYGGLLTLLAHTFGMIAIVIRWLAFMDGVVTRAEKCIMGTMKAIFIMMFCIEGISLLWGCYVFFGQFADWTSDPDESSFFYCNAVPYWPGFLLQVCRSAVLLVFVMFGIKIWWKFANEQQEKSMARRSARRSARMAQGGSGRRLMTMSAGRF